jgi:hypothetical protein
MTNQTTATPKDNKYKYGVKHDKADKEYIKLKNKMYYQTIKESKPNKAKATLINYYKRKYGDDYIINLIECLGVEAMLIMVRGNKYNKEHAQLEELTMPYLEVY